MPVPVPEKLLRISVPQPVTEKSEWDFGNGRWYENSEWLFGHGHGHGHGHDLPQLYEKLERS